MATYNKRGYKASKEKEEKLDSNYIEKTPIVEDKDSTTAGVFNTLDISASKTEAWVEKNQKIKNISFEYYSFSKSSTWLFNLSINKFIILLFRLDEFLM